MRVYTYSEARQNLASVLETAQRDGAVRIRRRNGQTFVLQPETARTSPLDVEGVDLDVTTDEIVTMIREGRERFG
jgi:prevent-host-death family protein